MCVLMLGVTSVAWAQRPIDERSVDTTKEILAERDQADATQGQLASWLAMGNYAEVQLAKLAQERTTNDAVRQFAQQMEKDHTAMLGDLKQFIPAVDVEARNESDTAAEKREIADQHHGTLMEVGRTAAKYKLAMTTKLLEQYEGQDFDMGYLGQQLVAHVDLLATLHAMKDQGTDEFQQVAAGQIEKVQTHFQHAQKLAKVLEDDRFNKPVDGDRIERLRPSAEPQPKIDLESKGGFKPKVE